MIRLALLFCAAVVAAPAIGGVSARDYEDFESCFGSLEGAAGVLPHLRDQMAADDYAAVQHAMQNLADDLADLEMRLAKNVFGAQREELARAHRTGRFPWQQPQNQSLDFWSRNAPMSISCFALTKRLNEALPIGF